MREFRRQEGAAWPVIARETGLDVRKLQQWNARARRAAPVPVLRPVEVMTLRPHTRQIRCRL